MIYFAYGSNMSLKRLEERVGKVECLGQAKLKDYCLKFHKIGQDGSGKCNILSIHDSRYQGSDEQVVYGVIYRITKEQKRILDKYEDLGRGYEILDIRVDQKNMQIVAFAYKAISSMIDETILPHGWYKDYVYEGALENNFPNEYINQIKRQRIL